MNNREARLLTALHDLVTACAQSGREPDGPAFNNAATLLAGEEVPQAPRPEQQAELYPESYDEARLGFHRFIQKNQPTAPRLLSPEGPNFSAPYELRKRQQKVIGFNMHWHPPGCSEEITTRLAEVAEVLFKPLGLLVWGATNKTRLSRFRVGNEEQFISPSPIPAKIFEPSMSFSEIQDLARSNNLRWPEGHYSLQECRTAEIGHSISIDVNGPAEAIAVWGIAIKG